MSQELPDEKQVAQSFSGRTLDAWAWIARARAAAAAVKREKAGKPRSPPEDPPAAADHEPS